MPSLKSLKLRINSVRSTRKITSAMKMVAAAKLRRAQEAAESARPYAERMRRMVATIAAGLEGVPGAPAMLAGTGREDTYLIVLCTADRGLCGGFNAAIIREARRTAAALRKDGRTVRFFCIGKRGRDAVRREFRDALAGESIGLGRRGVAYEEAAEVAARIARLFADGAFDVCTIIYNRFKSAMTQVVTPARLIPLGRAAGADDHGAPAGPRAVPIYEPDEAEILAGLLPRNLAVQIFQALLESSASEQGARMTAMDSATRNAGDMIDRLTLTYNRTRQAAITKELIEIISGAEAL